jgi:hypothetical protein
VSSDNRYPYVSGGQDYLDFHQDQRTKYADRQARRRQTVSLMKLWLLINAGLLAFLAAFVLTYLYCTGAWTP